MIVKSKWQKGVKSLTFLGTEVASRRSEAEVFESDIPVLLHTTALEVAVCNLCETQRQVRLQG